MPVNDFLPFAQGGGANVESQSSYAADPLLPLGNQPGVAVSAFNNKALRQANAITSQVAQLIANLTNTDIKDDANPTKLLAQISAALTPLPAISTSFAASGTWVRSWVYFIASGSASSGATYTNNGVTYTVSATVASALMITMKGNGAPTSSGTLTKASGTGDATLTFYAVRTAVRIEGKLLGPGGGGGGAGTSGETPGGDGSGNSTFAGMTAGPGTGGKISPTGSGSGGVGGTGTLGSNATGRSVQGSSAGSGSNANIAAPGGVGGTSSEGGGGLGGPAPGSAGGIAATNSGSGGGGAGGASSFGPAGGGGSGASTFFSLIPSFLATFFTGAVVIGTGGTAGNNGTSGGSGGAGADGALYLTEIF